MVRSEDALRVRQDLAEPALRLGIAATIHEQAREIASRHEHVGMVQPAHALFPGQRRSLDGFCFVESSSFDDFGLSFFGFFSAGSSGPLKRFMAAAVPWRIQTRAAWAAVATASSTAFRSPGLNREST